jgi:hypothetical protein
MNLKIEEHEFEITKKRYKEKKLKLLDDSRVDDDDNIGSERKDVPQDYELML